VGILDGLGSRGLIDWSRVVVDGLAGQICQGRLRYQLWWLPRLIWSVMLVVLVVLLAVRSGWALPPVPAAEATKGTRLGVPFTTVIAVYGYDHRVCGCVTNCVTITTYGNGLLRILRDV
jgi:hypothetical protein